MKMFTLVPSAIALSALLALSSIVPAWRRPFSRPGIRSPQAQKWCNIRYMPAIGMATMVSARNAPVPAVTPTATGIRLLRSALKPAPRARLSANPSIAPSPKLCATQHLVERSAPAACHATTAIEPAKREAAKSRLFLARNWTSRRRDCYLVQWNVTDLLPSSLA